MSDKTPFNFTEYIEDNTLRCEASYRGGGIEIDASDYLLTPGAKMTAYQNYLGGGMLGAIQFDCNIRGWQDTEIADRVRELSDELMRYFHNLTNHEDDEWEAATFEQNQNRPGSAY